MDDEFYFSPDPIATPLVLSAGVDVFTSDVPQDDRPLEDLFQFSHVVNSCTTFVNCLLPPLYFLPSCGCKSLTSQDALEVVHNPLCHAVEVAVSQRSKVGRVRASGRAARSCVALTSLIRALRTNLPALACMPSAISMSPMSSGSSSSTLQVKKTAEAPSTSNSSLASLRISPNGSAGSVTEGRTLSSR